MTTTAIILAAGMGTRMRSHLPKAMHLLNGKPMIRHILSACEMVFDNVVVVVGPNMEALESEVYPHQTVIQHDRLGTGHAALQAASHFGDGDVAILYADNPLVSPKTLQDLLSKRKNKDVDLVLLAMQPENPGHYGRLITKDENVLRIVEWADASDEERSITLCNAGAVCASARAMKDWLSRIENKNSKNEYYLTDVISLANKDNKNVCFVVGPESELRGINSPEELAEAEKLQAAQKS